MTIRGFEPGDEPSLLAVNAAAFASHPEQGAMDGPNLAARMAEPWFDPAGLLMAVDADGAACSASTGPRFTATSADEHGHALHERPPAQDLHDRDGHGPHGHDPLGEVYVVGVLTRTTRGQGLGRALALGGPAAPARRGAARRACSTSTATTPAGRRRCTSRWASRRWDTDVLFRRG